MTFVSVRPILSADTSGTNNACLSLEEALILNRVTEWAWQVCDSRCAPHSPGYLLGFIEHVGDGVELMQVGNKFIWTQFPSVRAALAHVVATAGSTEMDKAAGSLAWVI
jgi:hypothetical protein